jgi:hypothetical protein
LQLYYQRILMVQKVDFGIKRAWWTGQIQPGNTLYKILKKI